MFVPKSPACLELRPCGVTVQRFLTPDSLSLRAELRSFLQTLLDLLQRAEDYIRDKVDLTFFTQTLPQLVEHIYSTAFIHTRERRDLRLSRGFTQIEGTSLAPQCCDLMHKILS